MQKDFESWNKIKCELNQRKSTPTFKLREVWWCSIGVNIRDEEDGKNKFFSRPVLIIRKFNKRIFWGIPLTTQIKESPHYYKIELKNRTQCAMLSQMKLFYSNRLSDKMGNLTLEQFNGIRDVLKGMI